jgi:hypothetical protein
MPGLNSSRAVLLTTVTYAPASGCGGLLPAATCALAFGCGGLLSTITYALASGCGGLLSTITYALASGCGGYKKSAGPFGLTLLLLNIYNITDFPGKIQMFFLNGRTPAVWRPARNHAPPIRSPSRPLPADAYDLDQASLHITAGTMAPSGVIGAVIIIRKLGNHSIMQKHCFQIVVCILSALFLDILQYFSERPHSRFHFFQYFMQSAPVALSFA